MAYCTNCGSIIPNNANFCHVCGTKVAVSDTFDNTDYFEEPKPEPEIKNDYSQQAPQYRSIYDEYRSNYNINESAPTESKRSFIVGLLGMIISIAVSIEAAATYGYGMLIYNESYGAISYAEYSESVKQLLNTTGIYLVLAAIVGLVMGIIGLIQAKKFNSKKGKIFSIIAAIVGVAALGFAIFVFIIGGQL